MNKFIPWRRTIRLTVVMGSIAFASSAVVASTVRPTFEEISGLIRSNLVGASAEQIDWLAVKGLLSELAPRVMLVDTNAAHADRSNEPSGIQESAVYRGSIGYLRLNAVAEGISGEIQQRYTTLESTNRLSGLVLDLRGANGDDYGAAVKAVDLFLDQEVPLLNWGEGLKSSHPKDNAIGLPVAVLMDGKTGGAAEALAGMLRESGVALLLGERTSGTAGIKKEFPLENGQFLKITVANIQLGFAQILPADGLKPDVEVDRSRVALVNTRSEVSGTTVSGAAMTNSSLGPRRLRMDEADLVRRWRGEMLTTRDLEVPAVEVEPETRDPVLVRALDMMDGLAILRSWQR